MFLTLGLLVFPSQLGEVALEGRCSRSCCVFVARPLAAFVGDARSRSFGKRERLVLGWAGLRGAVPVVLATFPVHRERARQPRALQHRLLRRAASRRCCRARRSSRWRARLGVTTSEPALPRPLAEGGTIRRLGAEVLEYPIAADDAIVGHRVRDLGLPRDAVVNVIVRDDQAIPPRGSTRLRAGDRLHVLDPPGGRARALRHPRPLARRPDRPPAAPARRAARPRGGLLHRRLARAGRRPARAPSAVGGRAVIEQLRIRRDEPGGLWVLDDGRYAVTGPLYAIGTRLAVSDWARRRMRRAEPDERAWLQTVIGALAADLPE